MKVSIKWAQKYSNTDITSISTDKLLKKIGAQLGAVEEVIDLGSKYSNIFVAKIAEVQKHPDADKLNICLIDDGHAVQDVERNEEDLVKVVCGAPNVREGMFVAWLPPGTTVPSTLEKDPFTLESREIRGIKSNGMLASSHELDISDDHSGILEITNNAHSTQILPGTLLTDVLALDDTIIDCENKMFTHRPDCFGILGVARELSGITQQAFHSPSWYNVDVTLQPSDKAHLPLQSMNDIKTHAPRFMVQVVENVSVHPSTLEIQTMLSRVGTKPINNIVDFTNYYMHLTAQPTHAFDYDKVKQLCGGSETVTIFPRMATDGEQLSLLNGKTITLTDKDIVIATPTKAIALAGVMGGSDTEVDETTKNIIIECANFDMYTIRRTSMRHGLFTEAVTRFNKGQSVFQIPAVLGKLVDDICQNSEANAGVVYDSYDQTIQTQSVSVSLQFVNERLGARFSVQDITQLLSNVEFTVEDLGDHMNVSVPFWRKDIEIAEDIVEEVGRLHGYDSLTVSLPTRSVKAAEKNNIVELKQDIRSILSSAGANEVLSYSFVSEKLLSHAGQNSNDAYKLGNALSPELQCYRLSLTPSLLHKVHMNIRAGYDKFALFEISKTHSKSRGVNEESLPNEQPALAFVYASTQNAHDTHSGSAYFTARRHLDFLASKLGVDLVYKPIDPNELNETNEVTAPFNIARSAYIFDKNSNVRIGIVGEYTVVVRKNFKLPVHAAGFEIDYTTLLKRSNIAHYQPLARFPGSSQDMTFKIDATVTYERVHSYLNNAIRQAVDDDFVTELIPIGMYQKEGDLKHVTFRLRIRHMRKTLKTDEINNLVNSLAHSIETNFDATRI